MTVRPENRQSFSFLFAHAQVTADTTLVMWKAGRKLRVKRVVYVNPTGLAQDPTNYFTVKLLKGATVVASWSTLTGAQGTITADTPVELVPSATAADLVFAADDLMKLFLDETGTATLPAGHVVVECEYLN